MSLISAVTPTEAPQAGVKRSITGRPTGLGTNLPAFRGKPVRADGPIKAPKLSQGNRQNEGTNVAIPYNRVCPLEFLSGWTGRLSPGDVAFVMKYPPGFLSKQTLGNNGTNGTATMSRVIGLDGVNRLLHGSGGDGWVAGDNVFVDRTVGDRTSPLKVLTVGADERMGGFKLSLLDAIRLDGVVKSNDEPYSFTSNGSRDAVVFNNVIQGPTVVNNGYLLYDPKPNPGLQIDGPGQPQSHGATLLRTVEAHPRGSIEGGYHIGGRDGGGVPGRVGSPWTGKGNYDYVASFTGTYTTYPAQMFDRNPQPMNSLFLGLRAYAMSPEAKLEIKNPDGSKLFKDATEAAAATCYFFQIMPFSSRKAWLCQHVQDELTKVRDLLLNDGQPIDPTGGNPIDVELRNVNSKPANAGASEDARRRLAASNVANAASVAKRNAIDVAIASKLDKINCTLVNHSKGEKKSRFDDDVFDAVRSEDLANMVGAWHLGRVMDVKAMRHTAYEGGPQDTGFALTVDVQIAWRNALMLSGGSRRPVPWDAETNATATDAEVSRMFLNFVSAEGFTGYKAFGYTGNESRAAELRREQAAGQAKDPTNYDTTERGAEVLRQLAEIKRTNDAKDQRAVDVFNAQNPAMRTLFGPLFASSITPRVLHLQQNAWVKLIPLRWPVLDALWFQMLTLAANLKGGLGSSVRPSNSGRADLDKGSTNLFLPPGDAADAQDTLTAQIHVQAAAAVLAAAFFDPALADAADAVRTLLKQAGLAPRNAPTGAQPKDEKEEYKRLLGRVFQKTVVGANQPDPSVLNRYAWFLILSGFRFPASDPHKRERWYLEGPTLYPTLEGLEDGPGAETQLTEENVASHHAAFVAAHPQPVGALSAAAAAWTQQAPLMSVAAEAARDAAPAPDPVAVTYDEDDLMDFEDDPPAPAAAPRAPVAAAAAAAAPVATDAAVGGAPVVAAAAAAAAARAAAPARGARKPSPARAARGGASSAAAAAAATAAAASSSAAAAPLAAAPARPRQRQAPGASTSTVASVFDSIFGANEETIAQAGAGDPVSSPTPSSGSEHGGAAPGPKTFRRPR